MIALLTGSLVYFYLDQSGFLGFNISQIPYNEIKQQDSIIYFNGGNGSNNIDYSSWAELGDFFRNLSYGFYEDIDLTTDIPFIPPVDPALAPQYATLLNSNIFNVTPAYTGKYWKMTAYNL